MTTLAALLVSAVRHETTRRVEARGTMVDRPKDQFGGGDEKRAALQSAHDDIMSLTSLGMAVTEFADRGQVVGVVGLPEPTDVTDGVGFFEAPHFDVEADPTAHVGERIVRMTGPSVAWRDLTPVGARELAAALLAAADFAEQEGDA